MLEFTDSEIINSNGQRYRVGWDEHGWFSMVRVEAHPEEDEWYQPEDAEIISLPPGELDAVKDVMDR